MSRQANRKLLVAGGIVISAWLLDRAIPAVVREVREAHWDLTDKVALLERDRLQLASSAGLQDSATLIRQRLLAQAPRLVSGGSPAEASDALAGLVTVTIEHANGKLSRTEALPDSAAAGLLRRVSLLAAFESDVRGMTTVLKELDQAEAIVTVQSLNVMVVDPELPTTSPETLRVELVVSGWYLERGQ